MSEQETNKITQAGNFFYESTLSFLRNLSEDTDIIDLKNEILSAIDAATEEHIRDHYHIIMFDSPQHKTACELLRDLLKFKCEWDGTLGSEGYTIVYLPVNEHPEVWEDNYDFRKIIETVIKLNPQYNILKLIFDENTNIIYKKANKKQ